jgi:hypothetical protein
MRRPFWLLFALLAASLAANPSSSLKTPGPSFWAERPVREIAGTLLEEMSDQEALGQVFMIGYLGEEPSPELLDWILRRHLGGV